MVYNKFIIYNLLNLFKYWIKYQKYSKFYCVIYLNVILIQFDKLIEIGQMQPLHLQLLATNNCLQLVNSDNIFLL
jgi:hypothetical protein